jgi:hypothetical protein
MGREEPGDFHPVMNEWGGSWARWEQSWAWNVIVSFYESWTHSLPQIPPERQDPKKLIEVAEELGFSFLLNLLWADKGQQTLAARGNCLSCFFPLKLIWTQGV